VAKVLRIATSESLADNRWSVRGVGSQVEKHDIGLHRLEVENNSPAARKTLSHATRVPVIVDEAVHVMVEGVQTGRRKYSDLPHGSPEHSTHADRSGDDLP
jgi:hypothetical protein